MMQYDVVCVLMQSTMTEDVTICRWMSEDAVGCNDAWHGVTSCIGMSLDAV